MHKWIICLLFWIYCVIWSTDCLPTTYTNYFPPISFVFHVNAGETISAWGDWDSSWWRKMNIYIYDPTGSQVACDCGDGDSAKTLTHTASTAGEWRVWYKNRHSSQNWLNMKITVGSNTIVENNFKFDDKDTIDELGISSAPCIFESNFTSTSGSFLIQLFTEGSDLYDVFLGPSKDNPIADYTYNSGTKYAWFKVDNNQKLIQKVSQDSFSTTPMESYTVTYDCLSCWMLIPDCLDCSSLTECISCEPGLFINSTGKCQLCSDHLSDCEECSDNSTCTKCITNHVTNTSSQCQPCIDVIDNCEECTDNQTCTECEANFVLTLASDGCEACSAVLDNCLECDSRTECTLCDTDYILFPNSTCGVCSDVIDNCADCFVNSTNQVECTACEVNFILETVDQCEPCGNYIDYCVECDNSTVCTRCDWLYYLGTPLSCPVCNDSITYCHNCTNEGDFCYECNTDYRFLHNSNTECPLCIDHVSNCSRCSDISTCLECESDYFYLNGNTSLCDPCNNSMLMCQRCTDETICLTVWDDRYTINTTSFNTTLCVDAMFSCNRCTSETYCIECVDGFFLNSNQCETCSLFCETCRSIDWCDQCEVDFYVHSTEGNCTCEVGWYVPEGCTTDYGCLRVNQARNGTCLICSESENFELQKTGCECRRGYEEIDGVCVPQCGDGVVLGEDCDDGNLVNGDGCSFKCSVQDGYVCDGNQFQPSACLLDEAFELNYLYITRSFGENAAELHFKITPTNWKLSRVTFLKISSLWIDGISHALESAYYEHEKGKIILQYLFSQSQLNKTITASIRIPSAKSSLNDVQVPVASQIASIAVSSQTNSTALSPQYMVTVVTDESVWPSLIYNNKNDTYDVINTCSTVIAYMALILMLVSLYTHKMIGVETLHTLQIVYLVGIMDTFESSAAFESLKPLGLTLGVTDVFDGKMVDLINPQQFRYVSQNRLFYLNFNIFAALLLIVSLAMFTVKFIFVKNQIFYKRYCKMAAKIKSQKQQSKFKKEKLKSEIQETKIALKDQLYHNFQRVQLVYERLFYPVSIFLLPGCIFLNGLEPFSLKNSQETYSVSSSYFLIPATITILIVFSKQIRKLTSQYKAPAYSLTFFDISSSISPQKTNSYSSAYLTIIFILSVCMSVCIQIDRMLTTSCLMGAISLLSGFFLLYKSAYELELNNRVVAFNFWAITVACFVVALDNMGLLSESSVYVCLLVEMLLLFLVVGFGFYRLFRESINQSSHHKIDIPKHANPTKKQQRKKNIKDTFVHNRYIYREQPVQNSRSNKSSQEEILYNGRMTDQSILNANLNSSEQTKDHDLVEDKMTELKRIKQRLRMEFNMTQPLDQNSR